MTEPVARRRAGKRGRLSRGARAALWVALALFVFMLANTAYLLLNRLADALELPFFASGRTSLPVVYQVLLLSHTGIGLVAAAIFIAFTVWHLPVVWRRRCRRTLLTGVGSAVGWLVLAGSGLFILTDAASRENAWVWWVHIAVAALVPLAYLGHRALSTDPPARRGYGRFGYAVAGVAAVCILIHATSDRDVALTPEAEQAYAAGLHKGPGGGARNVADFTDAEFVPAAFVPPTSPFFPSAMTTTTGGYLPERIITRGETVDPETMRADLERHGFVTSEKIGAAACNRCHQDIVAQWSASAHRFASFNNPFYEATITDMRENSLESNPWLDEHIRSQGGTAEGTGRFKSKWCAGCHDPALLMTGRMNDPVDRATTGAQAGLTCLACHNMDTVHNNTGNGAFNLADEQEDPYLFPRAESGAGEYLHDLLVKAKPTVHKRQMLKSHFRTAEYCSACHKVNLDRPVNNYRWLRGQNEYDAWHDSGVAHNAARTFYEPPAARACQDCHMPPEPAVLGDLAAKNGMVRSHRFLAVNTALPYIRGDTETIERIEAFLREDRLRVDVFALRREGADAPLMALDKSRPVLVAGESAQLSVVVRNRNVGHTFPGGTNDSNEGWLEVSVLDANGRALFVSGAVGPDGHVDPDAHFYKALLVDRGGQPIHMRNAQDIYAPVFVRVIGPGTADAAHFALEVPATLVGSHLTLRARLLWRKFDRAYTEFAYTTNPEGFRAFQDVPDLPITEIAADEVTLAVVAPGTDAKQEPVALPDEWMRFNDYGIGLLLQGDTRGAARAFEQVRRLAPERLDGHRNLARVAIGDGKLEQAYEHLRACEALLPADPRTAWFWGVALQEDGRYPEAAAAYRRVVERYPGDRAAWRNLGRTLYLDGRYEEALAALDQVLDIDAEDRVAHYHRMLCLRALGRESEARLALAAYEKYQIDESAQEVTRGFLLDNPSANLQTQAIPVHPLKPVAGTSVALSGQAVPMREGSVE